jgi:hypothetical protein
MQSMMDFQFVKKRHEELLREAEMNRRVKALRATGKGGAGRRSALASELKRHVGRFRKRLKRGERRWIGFRR